MGMEPYHQLELLLPANASDGQRRFALALEDAIAIILPDREALIRRGRERDLSAVHEGQLHAGLTRD